jgi:hypothetical protein
MTYRKHPYASNQLDGNPSQPSISIPEPNTLNKSNQLLNINASNPKLHKRNLDPSKHIPNDFRTLQLPHRLIHQPQHKPKSSIFRKTPKHFTRTLLDFPIAEFLTQYRHDETRSATPNTITHPCHNLNDTVHNLKVIFFCEFLQ